MSGAAGGAPPSGLLLLGVPVELLSGMSSDDFSPASPYSALGYQARRPAGTPLMEDPAPPLPEAPAPYVNSAVTDILVNRVLGLSPQDSRQAQTGDDTRVVVEMHLALAEAAATLAGGPLMAPTQAGPVTQTSSLGAPFAAVETPRAPWLSAGLALSTARSNSVGRIGSPDFTGGDPVGYVASSSAFWQAVSPFGGDLQANGAAAAAALALAAQGSAAIVPDEFDVGAAQRPPPTHEPDWVQVARDDLAGRLRDQGRGPQAPVPSPVLGAQGLADLLIERHAEALRPPPATEGRNVYVIGVGTVQAALANMDVMREHEQRFVRRG